MQQRDSPVFAGGGPLTAYCAGPLRFLRARREADAEKRPRKSRGRLPASRLGRTPLRKPAAAGAARSTVAVMEGTGVHYLPECELRF